MGIIKTWVFPILRILIFLVIAVALVKIAFFADPAPGGPGGGEVPTGAIVEPEVPATIGTITNNVTVPGTVAADAAVPVKATVAGEVVKLLIGVGQPASADTPVLSIKSTTPGAVRVDGTVAPDVVKTSTVNAGAAGIVSSIAVIPGQTVAVGEDVAQVAPTTFNVSGTIAPEQQYRLLTRPTEAQVTITGGPAPFTCTGLTITTALAGGSQGGEGAGGGSTTGATVRCSVPPEVTVFAGLAASLSLAGGVAENVLIVPVTAVEGTAGTGNVYVMLDDGTSEPRPVTLGINDGVNVEVKEGLTEGDMVLQFVPGAERTGADIGGGCTELPDGTVECVG